MAYAGGSMVGFGHTFPCTPEYWYDELLPEIHEHVRAGRLMALCEFAVPPPGSPGASALHAELLKSINPQWSSLSVRPDTGASATAPNRRHTARHAGAGHQSAQGRQDR